MKKKQPSQRSTVSKHSGNLDKVSRDPKTGRFRKLRQNQMPHLQSTVNVRLPPKKKIFRISKETENDKLGLLPTTNSQRVSF